MPTSVAPECGIHGGVYWERRCPPASKGAPVVLIHGLGNSGLFWAPVATGLSVERAVVVVDVPGFGRSAAPPGRWSVSSLVEPIMQVLSHLGIETFEACGHSFGGMIAAELAARSGSRCTRLVMLDGHLFAAADVIRHPRLALRSPVLALALASQIVGGMLPLRSRFARNLVTGYLPRRWLLWPFMATPVKVGRHVITSVLAENIGGLSAVRAVGLASSFDLREVRLTTPVVIAYGERDRLIAPQDNVIVREIAVDVRVLVIAGAGHWPHIEAVDRVVEILS